MVHVVLVSFPLNAAFRLPVTAVRGNLDTKVTESGKQQNLFLELFIIFDVSVWRVTRRDCNDAPVPEEQETEGQRQLHSLLLQQLDTGVDIDR